MPSSENAATRNGLDQLVVHNYPIWLLRFWHGMEPGAWLRILLQNRFRVHPTRFYVAFTVTAAGPLNAFFRLCQDWLYGRRIARTEIETPPVFIIGHWRSGTTFLHELLAQDDRFGYPTTYECFAPRHFLVSQWIMPRLLGFLLPRTRPMDNMDAAFHLPQEDEFALANMGAPTPYLHLVFPNQPPCYMELLDMEQVPPDVLERWKQGLLWFAKALTFSKRRPLILKSPPHTGRVQILSELFPGARFI
ncbi:MAG TPA: sulfotransferase, partial [Planctomycetaceae bacterium]|nr:sulfotransferase [Planctomycetaceae bacterium]